MTRDDAVIGEAAGLAMGLVMLGTKSPIAIEDMTNVTNPEGVFTPPLSLFSSPSYPLSSLSLCSMLEILNTRKFREVWLWAFLWYAFNVPGSYQFHFDFTFHF